MSTTVDERVVSMQFDCKRFVSNVATTISTLDKLRQSLNLTGASKGLENVNTAANNVNMSGLSNAVETVRARFSALQVMGITALTNITNQAVNAGKRIVSALTIDPIKTGFSEYETQIGAVQTILANTQSKGSTLQDVNRSLDDLNTYADKTIYNFTEMTRNIGTFTAAGVDLDKSVTSIKGIANLAAVSGSTSQQASTAMYQLSQALAAGKVQLMDWNSVVNAGMGGQVFQDALKRTAKNMGTDVDALIKKYGSFRESLTKGEWLTADVLTETLTQLSGAYTEADLLAKGYTESQAKEILDLADTAVQAATKVKTVSQLWDTLKESAQSGWTQTWEIVVGDFEEAKETLTKVSDTIGEMINNMSESRNKLLEGGLSSGWKQLLGAGISDEEGFKDTIKEVTKEHGVNFDKMAKKNETFEQTLARGLKNGKINADMLSESVTKMADKMSKMSDEELKAAGYTNEHIKQIKELSKGLKDGSVSMDDFVKKIMRPSGRQNIIDSLWNTFNALMDVIKPIKEAFSEIFPAMTGEQLYTITENLKKFTEGLKLSEEASDKIKRTFKGLFSIFDILRKGISAVVGGLFDLSQSKGIASLADLLLDITASIGDFFTSINEGFDSKGLSGGLSKAVSGISGFIGMAVKGLEGFVDILSTIGDYIVKAVNYIWKGIKVAFNWIADNISAGDIFAGLAGGGIFLAAKKLMGFIDKIQDTISNLFKKGDDGKTRFSDILGSVKESLESFTSGIKVASLVGIAAAVALLSSSLRKISELDAVDIGKSLFAIGTMMTMLNVSFKSITKSLDGFKGKGFIKGGIALMMLAKAIDILADAMVEMSELSLPQVAKGLIGIGGGIVALSIGLKAINKVKISLSTSVAMIALAESCKKLADAVSKFGSMSWEKIGRGLTAMGGALVEFVAALAVLKKVGGFKSLLGSTSLLIAVQSLSDLADGLKKFGSMSWDEIGRGLVGMGGALAEVAIITGALGYLAGFSGILGGAALVVAVQSLGDLADALKKFGKMEWDDIGRGLSAMGGALLELGVVTGALGYLTGFSGILGGAALVIAVQSLSDLADALKKFGEMSWDQVKIGLTGMGGALTELSVTVGLLGKLAGFSGFIGDAVIYIVVQMLDDIAASLKKFGEMSWDEIVRGLVGMGGALTELAVITGVLGKVAPIAGLLGGGALSLAMKELGTLADAFAKFGSMSWDEIGRGLVGMGAALTEVAVISGVLGSVAPIAGLLGGGALTLAIQELGTLADAFKKFGEMSWDEIGRGLTAMGGALSEVALGGLLSTLSGIGAKAIADVSEPLGTLADSVKKWADVTIPENLGWQLGLLANGIFSFTFGGNGASALATAAPAIGVMADSVKKWAGVTIPEGLSGKISGLSKALSGWWNEGLGASAMLDAATGIGTMADSIKKWKDVTIPDGLTDNLTALSDAVKSFSWAFMGGWSLSSVSGPLGDLADDIKKWKDVSIPAKLSEKLESLSDAIKSFSWAFMGGWSLSAVTGPLGDLAKAVKKWKDVTIPKGLSGDLKSLATGLKSFNGITNLSSTVGNVAGLRNSVSKLSKVNFENINSGLSTFADKISKLVTKSKSLSGVGEKIVKNIVDPIKKMNPQVTEAGSKIVESLAKGMKSKQPSVNMVTLSLVNSIKSAVKGIRGYYDEFRSAGSYLVSGFANGIDANTYRAEAKSRAMAAAAARAAKRELDEHSPSKVGYEIGDFFGIAFVNAIGDNEKKAYKASANVAKSAKNGLNDAIHRIKNAISGDIDSQPTIRPVLDLSDVKSGAGAIGNLLNINPSLGVASHLGAISSMMNNRIQNGGNDDVISAIDKLSKSLGNVGGDTYNFGGFTYSGDDEINDAVKVLIRAARLGGRV